MPYISVWQSPNDNQWYWHIRGDNHETLASSEGYTTKRACTDTAKLVRNTVGSARVWDVSVKPPKDITNES